jgi:hypothetical protein
VDPDGELKITFKDELLTEPVLLTVDIANTGNTEILCPPIEIEAMDSTYVIPGYFESVPNGYEDLWELERTDADSCAIKLDHINPGQIVKARFLLDEMPKKKPILKCPLPGLEIRKLENVEVNSFLQLIIEIWSPKLATTIKALIGS